MSISADEKIIQGAWRVVGGRVEADAAAQRIDILVHGYLNRVGADESGWDVLYVDPHDGRYWELVYLESESHGGGPPTLRQLTEGEARKKYISALRT